MFRYIFLLPHYITKSCSVLYNRFKMRLSGAVLGDDCKIYHNFYLLIKKGGRLEVGDSFTMQSGTFFNPIMRGTKSSIYVSCRGKVKIGDNTGISSSCIWCVNSIAIGNHVKIGANCIIMDNDAHSLDYMIRKEPEKDVSISAPIVIEDDVLVGANSIILKGVTIGARSIIGAGSVVTKDIPADCIAAGNPCRIIRRIEKS